MTKPYFGRLLTAMVTPFAEDGSVNYEAGCQLAGIDAAAEKVTIDSIGIDTWGVDFVLLDEKGEMVSDAVAYRDTRTAGADAEIERDVLSFKNQLQIAAYTMII